MQLTTLRARVGRSLYPVMSWQQVSDAYLHALNKTNLGASQAPRCEIINPKGEVVAHVSYNGKVWPGQRWTSGDKPLYVPEF